MARNEIAMLVDVYKNRNTASKTYGQFYGRVFNRETLSLKGFAKHMTEHGKRLSEEELVLFLKQVVSCLKELIVQGQPVKLDGLGTFYPSLESTGASSPQTFDPLLNIVGVHMNFRPEAAGGADEKLTSRILKGLATFKMNDYVIPMVKMVDGKKKTYYERHPIATYDIENADGGDDPTPDPEPDPEP